MADPDVIPAASLRTADFRPVRKSDNVQLICETLKRLTVDESERLCRQIEELLADGYGIRSALQRSADLMLKD